MKEKIWMGLIGGLIVALLFHSAVNIWSSADSWSQIRAHEGNIERIEGLQSSK